MYRAETKTWYIDRLIRLIAGIFVLGSVLLGYFAHPAWLFFTGFVGIMLIVYAGTGFCPMGMVLHALGAPEQHTCGTDAATEQMQQHP
jgi:hypothetical protein